MAFTIIHSLHRYVLAVLDTDTGTLRTFAEHTVRKQIAALKPLGCTFSNLDFCNLTTGWRVGGGLGIRKAPGDLPQGVMVGLELDRFKSTQKSMGVRDKRHPRR